MDKLKEYLDYIVEFCQDHNAAVITGAAVLVILLLCFVLVRSARRQDLEDEMPEDGAAENGSPEEAESPEENGSPEEAERFEAAEIDEIKEESKKDIDIDKDIDMETETETEMPSLEQAQAAIPEPLPDPLPKPAASQLETEIVKTIGGGNLTALPVQFSTQNLKSVEIHIEKAHITFHYASPEEKSSLELGEADQHTAGDAAECGTAGQCGAEDGAECSTAGTADPEAAECDAGMDFTETEEGQIDIRTQAVKKYGAENRNVSRSGREYTVEELYVKIRD